MVMAGLGHSGRIPHVSRLRAHRGCSAVAIRYFSSVAVSASFSLKG